MARWASLIEQRRRERPVLVIDAGDFSVPPETRFPEVTNRYFFAAMKLLRYDAVGVSGSETAAGLEGVIANAHSYGIPLVSSNILDRGSKKPVVPTSIVKEIGGSSGFFGRKGSVRVGIFAVVLPGFIYRSAADAPKRYSVIEATRAARDAVAALRSRGCDLIVAVSHLGWPSSLNLAREVPGIDVVLNGFRSHKTTCGERSGRSLVVDTGDNEGSFAEVSVTFHGDSVVATAADVCSLAVKSPGDPRLLELQRKYAAEIKRLTDGSSPSGTR